LTTTSDSCVKKQFTLFSTGGKIHGNLQVGN
jgi:hypothetical protein